LVDQKEIHSVGVMAAMTVAAMVEKSALSKVVKWVVTMGDLMAALRALKLAGKMAVMTAASLGATSVDETVAQRVAS
jgi:malonyl CoA-acyl carrier protein transacylase